MPPSRPRALADKAQSTYGVVSADSQEAREYQARPQKPGEQQPDMTDDLGFAPERQVAVSDALQAARIAALARRTPTATRATPPPAR